jgi:nitrogen fixation NifU-like protein
VNDDLYRERMLRLAGGGDSGEPLADANASVTLDNPLCGDRVTVELRCDEQGRVMALAHGARGCVLCRAATAVLGANAPGRDLSELAAVRARLQGQLRDGAPPPDDAPWSDLAVFTPVAPHKSRHDCVLLPFDAALQALEAAMRAG